VDHPKVDPSEAGVNHAAQCRPCSNGSASVDLAHYRIHTPLTPFNAHVAGTAIA
jgi:hypothetical protein